MARSFTRASTHFLESSAVVVTATPLTMACWFNSDSTTVNQVVLGIGATVGAHYWNLRPAGAVSGDSLQFVCDAAVAAATAFTTTSYLANTWHHACGVAVSPTSRLVYLDGGGVGTEVTSRTPAPGNLNRVSIGRFNAAGVQTDYMSGRIAECAIWNVALSASEVAMLAKGLAPPYIQPGNLKGYWPLWGAHSPEIDLTPLASNQLMTVTGAVTGNHASVQPFSSRRWGSIVDAGTAAAGQPTMRRWSGVPHLGHGQQIGRTW